jgi:hypothetical protein
MKQRATHFVVLAACILSLLINMLPFVDGRDDLLDFGSFYAAGVKLANGENPYDSDSEYIFEINFAKVGAGGRMSNLNPPISVVFFQALPMFDPHAAMLTWQIVSVVLYAISVLLLVQAYRQNISASRFIWAFVLAGFWHTIVLGQIYAVLLLFSALAWIWLKDGRFAASGIAMGIVVAIKPNFVIWPVFLLFSGYAAAGLACILTGLAISIIPILIWGTEIYRQWFSASALRLETLIMPGNNSIVGLTGRFESVTAGLILSAIVVLAMFVLSRYRSIFEMDKAEYVSALGIIASLLVSPISWTGYTILLLPVFFSLRKWTGPVVISALILAIPFQIVLQLFQRSEFSFIFFGWLYGWGILLLLGEFVRKSMMTSSIQTN